MAGTRARMGTWRALLTVAAVLLTMTALVTAFSGRAVAKGDSSGGESHPAHIHKGTCDTLDPNPQYPLGNISTDFVMEGTPAAMGDEGGAEASLTVAASVTTVSVSLDDLLAQPHAINVHKSADEIQTYIACGNIGGRKVGDTLVIGLAPQKNSGYSGVAVLEGSGSSTKVSVYLTSAYEESGAAGSPAAAGTPAAASGGSAATSGGTAVDIKGFAFNPATIEISAGTTVTWTNDDGAAHTVTADDNSWTSPTLNQGQTYSHTFDTPGTYAYHCNFHGSMKATIVVK